jgi:26S proteasome regulatory subunit N2
MKVEGPSAKSGDTSPTEETKPQPSNKSRKSTEPSSERITNFTRVTPAQLSHIIFPSDSRYQPVRALTTRSGSVSTSTASATERLAGGGGILILVDRQPDQEADIIDLTPPPPPAPAASEPVAQGPIRAASDEFTGRHMALDENAPEAPPPASFEVCLFVHLYS